MFSVIIKDVCVVIIGVGIIGIIFGFGFCECKVFFIIYECVFGFWDIGVGFGFSFNVEKVMGYLFKDVLKVFKRVVNFNGEDYF